MPKKNIDEARNLAEKLSEWASFNGQIDDPYVSGLLKHSGRVLIRKMTD